MPPKVIMERNTSVSGRNVRTYLRMTFELYRNNDIWPVFETVKKDLSDEREFSNQTAEVKPTGPMLGTA